MGDRMYVVVLLEKYFFATGFSDKIFKRERYSVSKTHYIFMPSFFLKI